MSGEGGGYIDTEALYILNTTDLGLLLRLG